MRTCGDRRTGSSFVHFQLPGFCHLGCSKPMLPEISVKSLALSQAHFATVHWVLENARRDKIEREEASVEQMTCEGCWPGVKSKSAQGKPPKNEA